MENTHKSKAVTGRISGSGWASLLSAFGIPVLGIGGLLLSLWHMNAGAASAPTEQQAAMFLQTPDARLDSALSVCLSQQYKQVAYCRARMGAASVSKAVAGYNLIAQECTPAVFASTHLPASLEP